MLFVKHNIEDSIGHLDGFIDHCIFIESIKSRVENWDLLSDTEKFVSLYNDHTRIQQ